MNISPIISVSDLIAAGALSLQMLSTLVKKVLSLRKRGATDEEIHVAIAESLKLDPNMDLIEDTKVKARVSTRATPRKVRLLEEISEKLDRAKRPSAKKAVAKKAVKKAVAKKPAAKKAVKKAVAKKPAAKKAVKKA